MYSIVLFGALTTAAGSPEHGWHHHGAGYGACYGVGYTGFGDHHPKLAPGGWGLPYAGYWPGYACAGGCGGYASYAYGMSVPTLGRQPVAPIDPRDEEKKEDETDPEMKRKDDLKKDDLKLDDLKKDAPKLDNDGGLARRARLKISLPADAKLFVDGQAIPSGPQQQVFRTPVLERGKVYYYELRAEVVRDGQTLVDSTKVTLRAGQEVEADFPKLRQGTGMANIRKD